MSTPSEFRKPHTLSSSDFLTNVLKNIEYNNQNLKEEHLAKLKLIDGANQIVFDSIGILIDIIFTEKDSFYKDHSNSISFAYNGLQGLYLVENPFKKDERSFTLFNEKVEEIIDFLSAMFQYAKERGKMVNIPIDLGIKKIDMLKQRLGQLKSDDQKYTKYLKLTPQQEEEKIEKNLTSKEQEALNKKVNEEIKALEEQIKKLDCATEEQPGTNLSEQTTNPVDFENKEQSNSQGMQ